MLLGRAALSSDQIVKPSRAKRCGPSIQIGFCATSTPPLTIWVRANHLSPSLVKLLHPDRAVPFIARHLVRHAVVDDVGSVAFLKDRRIDAFETQPDRSITVQPGSLP
jgi:hypothetical protein